MIYWKKYKIVKFPVYTYKRLKYLDCIISFDIEATTFFYVNGEWIVQDMSRLDHEYFDTLSAAPKLAVPYIWQMAINDDIIYGREISEFFDFWERFKTVNYEGTAIVYVHNLGYDFEFVCERLPIDVKAFAKAPFKPMKVDIYSMGLVFRCSYMLTNMSLENCAKEFKLDVEKTTELDYSVARLPITPLSETELHYCENDVKIINTMIKKIFLTRYDNIADIPLTQTGEVRREVKKITAAIPYHMYTLNKIKPDLGEYKILTKVVAGGYTHLNGLYNGIVVKNVDSYDKKSSYPDIMCTRKFPSEKWHKCNCISDTEKYAYMINVRFTAVECKYTWAYISAHKAKSKNAHCDNGKIFSADWIELWCTELDYILIKECYNIEQEELLCAYRSYKKYLPRELILYILKRYGEKSSLKGLVDFQSLYLRSKQLINSIFGLSLTNTIVPDIVFNALSHLWDIPEILTDLQISEKLGKQRPFLNFSWGAWITAYGRYDVFSTLLKINIDAVYSDTDSVKCRNGKKYEHIFEEYNQECEKRIDAVCSALNIDKALFFPKNNKGEVQSLGFFEYEGQYEKFKSLGSKKYCYVKDGKFEFVVAGLKKTYLYNNKKIPTMTSMEQMFNGSIIPHARSVHWHLTEQPEVELTDYLGNKWINNQKQGIAFLSACYTFGVTNEYKGFILNIRNKYTNYFRGGFNE